MSGILLHKPSQIVASALRNGSLGSLPPDQTWPIFNDGHAAEPEELICVYDTVGIIQGQSHIGGQVTEHYGIQIKVRAKTNLDSFKKAKDIALYCDALTRRSVTIDSTSYTIHAMARKGSIISIGPEAGDLYLHLHTVNYTLSLTVS